jgi:enoyl-CoA hydratase/carnithine racemase
MSELVQISREGRCLRLTLNREDKRNALNAEMCRTLVAEVEGADADRSVSVVLIDARGPVFCAGMDLDEASSPNAVELTGIHERLFTLGLRVSVPIIMAAQGPALGGGVGLLANGHIVVAAQGSSFTLSEVRLGMWPFVIFRALTVALGERHAVALSMSGRVFSVQEALQFGLVHEIAPAIEVEDRATAIAQYLCELSPETLRRGLSFVHRIRGMADAEAVAAAAHCRAENFASPDFAEGVRAFREKRKARWPSLD